MYRCPFKLQHRRIAMYANDFTPALKRQVNLAIHIQWDWNQIIGDDAVYRQGAVRKVMGISTVSLAALL